MQYKLIINGVDFAPWLAANVVQGTAYRNARSVVTRDGRLHKTEREKRTISVPLITLSDSMLHSVMTALTPRLASVTYTDRDTGANRTAQFYINNPTATAKRVLGSTTWYEGVSFTLEER